MALHDPGAIQPIPRVRASEPPEHAQANLFQAPPGPTRPARGHQIAPAQPGTIEPRPITIELEDAHAREALLEAEARLEQLRALLHRMLQLAINATRVAMDPTLRRTLHQEARGLARQLLEMSLRVRLAETRLLFASLVHLDIGTRMKAEIGPPPPPVAQLDFSIPSIPFLGLQNMDLLSSSAALGAAQVIKQAMDAVTDLQRELNQARKLLALDTVELPKEEPASPVEKAKAWSRLVLRDLELQPEIVARVQANVEPGQLMGLLGND